MFNPMHCSICNDKNQYRMAVMDAERINQNLSHYVQNTHPDIKDRAIWSTLCNDSHHVHFMCGMCHQVNSLELHNAEERLRRTIYAICKESQTDETIVKAKGDILRQLQGYYPLMWRVVNQHVKRKEG